MPISSTVRRLDNGFFVNADGLRVNSAGIPLPAALVTRVHSEVAAQTSAQNVSTVINLEVTDFNTLGATIDGTTGGITVPYAGYYRITGSIYNTVATAGASVELQFRKNGTISSIGAAPATIAAGVSHSTIFSLAVGDKIELSITHSGASGGSIYGSTASSGSYRPFLSVEFIG